MPPRKNPRHQARRGYLCGAEFLRSPVASCDNWNFNTSNPVVYVGGNYNQNGNHGLFYVNYTSVTNSNANYGSRFLFVLLTSILHIRHR